MKKNKGFFGSLQKSTKVTLLSCISFIALTLLILIFFILFPITPSERIMASIGRENMYNNNPQNVTPVVTSAVTTASTANSDIFGEETGTRTTKTYKIVITTGSGFLWNGRIPDGISDTETTVVIHDEPRYPTADPGYRYPHYTQPSAAEPEPPATDVTPADPIEPADPVIPADPIEPTYPVTPDPPATDIPAPTDPPLPDPAVTQPPIIIDPNPPADEPSWSDPSWTDPGWSDPNAGTEYGDDVSAW